MIVIKTTCTSCGEVSVPLSEVHLHGNTGSNTKYFSYVCPECGETRGGEADSRFVGFLIGQGIMPEYERFAPEVLELHVGPSIVYDDILDFHLLLESPDWIHDLEDSFEVA